MFSDIAALFAIKNPIGPVGGVKRNSVSTACNSIEVQSTHCTWLKELSSHFGKYRSCGVLISVCSQTEAAGDVISGVAVENWILIRFPYNT